MIIAILYSLSVLFIIFSAYSYLGYRAKKREWKKKVEVWYDTKGNRRSFIAVWGDRFDQSPRAENIRRQLVKANIHLNPSEFYGILILGVVVFSLFLNMFFGVGFPLNLVMGVIAVIITRFVLFMLRRNKFQERINSQMPEICRLLANGTRSGMTLNQAIELASQDLADPAREEFRRMSQELRLGVNFEMVLRDMQERIPSKEFRLFAATLLIQKKAGGDLHSVLDEMAQTFDERQVLVQEIDTMTAEQRYISFLVPLMPVILIFMMNTIIDDFVKPLFHGAGLILLALFLTGTGLTFFLVRKVTHIKV